MSDKRRPGVRGVVALLATFGLGVWYGSEKTVRRVRHLSDPENRKWLKQQVKRARRDRKTHPLQKLLR